MSDHAHESVRQQQHPGSHWSRIRVVVCLKILGLCLGSRNGIEQQSGMGLHDDRMSLDDDRIGKQRIGAIECHYEMLLAFSPLFS